MDLNFKNLTKRIGNFFREAGGSSSQITNSNIKNFIVKHVGWNSESDDYAASENDLAEVKSAIETDSTLKVALDKTAQLVMKQGYKLESNNEAAMEYLKQRIAMIEFGTGVPFNILLTEIAQNLVYYSNCFLAKSRIDKIQGGLQAKPVLGKKAVGGYFIMDPTIIEIKRSTDGTIEGYKLSGTEETEFAAADVIHFFIDRAPQNNFGTPRAISVLEDIKILRKIEGSCLSLIYRYALPLVQCKIGVCEQGMFATNQEISEAQDQINKMPLDGIIVTNERTQFITLNAEGQAISLDRYLEYFEKRVFTGLGQSLSTMGRETSAGNADMQSGLLTDIVKHYQAAMATFIEQGIFNEILLEGGYNPIFNIDDKVHFKFNEINLDTKVKIENHLLNQYQNNAITFEEMRMGFDRATAVDESRLYTNLITTPNQIAVVEAKLGGGDGGNRLTNGNSSNKNGNGQAKSVVAPSNQHGTTSAKIKEHDFKEANLEIDTSDPKKRNRILGYRLQNWSMYNIYKGMRNNLIEKHNFSENDILFYKKELCDEFDKKLQENTRLGFRKSLLTDQPIECDETLILKTLSSQSHVQIEKMVDDIASKINIDKKPVDTVMEYMEYRLRFACDFYLNKAFNAAQINGYSKQGISEVKLNLSDSHSKHEAVLATDNINIDNIPPFNPYCSCTIIEPEVIL